MNIKLSKTVYEFNETDNGKRIQSTKTMEITCDVSERTWAQAMLNDFK